MTTIYPLAFQWDGEVMVPLNPRGADRQYVVGEHYRLVPHEDVSVSSRNHYFACIAESHRNLPDETAAELPTPEHLRKFALIKAGYYNKRSILASTLAEARSLAAFIKPMDEYAIVTIEGKMVSVYAAQSQSGKAMGRETFQASKQAVLDIVSEMVGISINELKSNAGRAA